MYYLSGNIDDTARGILRAWLQADKGAWNRCVVLHAALARAGDAASIAWLAEQIGSLSADATEQEWSLLQAVRRAGPHPEIVKALAGLLEKPGGAETRANGLFNAAPPRAYVASRALAALFSAEDGAPKLQTMRITQPAQAIDACRQWVNASLHFQTSNR